MNATQKLYDVIKDFSEPVLAEVVDFAEFLRQKCSGAPALDGNEPLADLAGGLEASAAFNQHPVMLQNRMRDEWN